MEMSRLTRGETAEPVSRDQILRHARGQGDIIFPVQLTTSRIGNLTRLIHTLLDVMTIHTYIMYCVYCVEYTVRCILYLVYCMVYTVWCILYGVYCILYTVSCMLYGV